MLVLGTLILALTDCGRASRSVAPGPPPELVDDSPAWTPDGSAVLYWHRDMTGSASYPTGLYLYPLPGGPKALVRAGYLFGATYSPDGSKIAYFAGGIHVMNSDGSEDSLVLGGDSFSPSWSPGGDMLALDTSLDDPRGASAIELLELPSRERRDISVHGTGEWKSPRWSPDGSRLVHERHVVGAGGFPEIFTMDTTGHGAVRLTDDKTYDRDPHWSRDGNLIGWTRYSLGIAEVWVMNRDGSGRHSLTRGQEPAFSPRADEVVFADPNSPSGSQLAIISIDGSHLRHLTP